MYCNLYNLQEFSDWRPLSTLDTGKRIKKGNPEKEKDKEQERVRERERDNSLSSSQGDGKPAPATYPRAKTTSSMAKYMALENLRQQLNFSDVDEVCVISTLILSNCDALQAVKVKAVCLIRWLIFHLVVNLGLTCAFKC